MSDSTRKGEREFAPKIVYPGRPGAAGDGSPDPAAPSPGPGTPIGRPAAAELEDGSRGRGLGLWLLAGLQIAIGLLGWVGTLNSARGWELERSFDVDEELQAALTGLDLMIRVAVIAAGGFLLSALALITLRRLGWFLAVGWAVLMTVTGLGAVYGLPALVCLFAPSTRARFH
jgi:hypothetical protein